MGSNLTTVLAIAGWTAWFAALALTSVLRRRRSADAGAGAAADAR